MPPTLSRQRPPANAVLLSAPDIAVNQVDSIGRTALMFASSKGHAEIVSLLIGAGAAVNQANTDGATPLFAAAHPRLLSQLTDVVETRASEKA